MSSSLRFSQVDVFSAEGFAGNPLAVVFGADDLTDAVMQQVAKWTNLSETTFLLQPVHADADYRVRIFTGSGELPFAGHPTLGSAHAWLEAGNVPAGDVIIQECAAGLIPIRQSEGLLAFAAPPLLRSGPVDAETLSALASTLNISLRDIVAAEWADNGPGWIAVLLASADEVLAIHPQPTSSFKIGVVGPHPAEYYADLEVRAFFPSSNGTLFEDPVTGSLNASIAQFLLGSGRIEAPYIAAQGSVLGRRGRVYVSETSDAVWIAGDVVTCISGEIYV
jgi:PhzF family phenazine biosynthesis protein